MPYFAITELVRIQASEDTVWRAFEAEGYHQHTARVKPWLSEQAKQRRLGWCLAHQDWLVADWHLD